VADKPNEQAASHFWTASFREVPYDATTCSSILPSVQIEAVGFVDIFPSSREECILVFEKNFLSNQI
jgi:hypothetical protein